MESVLKRGLISKQEVLPLLRLNEVKTSEVIGIKRRVSNDISLSSKSGKL